MAMKIIYPRPSGFLALLTPTGEVPIEEVVLKDIPAGVPYEFVNYSDLPNFSFFDAWEADFENFQGISINLEKAKVIYKTTADNRAAGLSQPLTQEYLRLLSIGADTTAVQAQLKAINAAAEETAYLDADSVDALIACWPPELGPNPFLPVSPEGVS